MQVTQQFIERLRHALSNEVREDLTDGAISHPDALAAFDRAALATVLNGSEEAVPAGPTAHQLRARKAANTRKRNKAAREKAQDTTREVRSESSGA